MSMNGAFRNSRVGFRIGSLELSGAVPLPDEGSGSSFFEDPGGRVAELADAPDLGSGPERGGGSSPPSPIIYFSTRSQMSPSDDERRSS